MLNIVFSSNCCSSLITGCPPNPLNSVVLPCDQKVNKTNNEVLEEYNFNLYQIIEQTPPVVIPIPVPQVSQKYTQGTVLLTTLQQVAITNLATLTTDVANAKKASDEAKVAADIASAIATNANTTEARAYADAANIAAAKALADYNTANQALTDYTTQNAILQAILNPPIADQAAVDLANALLGYFDTGVNASNDAEYEAYLAKQAAFDSAYADPLNDLLLPPGYVDCSQRVKCWETLGSCIKSSYRNVLYITFDLSAPFIPDPLNKAGPSFVLNIAPLNLLNNNVRILSILMNPGNSNTILLDQESEYGKRIYFPPGTLTTDVMLVLIVQDDACSADYTQDQTDTWNAVIKSSLFTTPGYVSLPDLATDIVLLSYSFVPYNFCNLPSPLVKDLLCLIKKINECQSTQTVPECDLKYIKNSILINQLKNHLCKRICNKKQKKTRELECNLVFDKYISFAVCSIKAFFAFERSSKCASLFTSCARRCENRVEACGIVCAIIAAKYRISYEIEALVETLFGCFISGNTFFNISYKESAILSGFSRSDCSKFGRHLQIEDINVEVVENSSDIEKIVSDEEEKMKKKRKERSFMGKYKWHITITVLFIVCACTAYAFMA